MPQTHWFISSWTNYRQPPQCLLYCLIYRVYLLSVSDKFHMMEYTSITELAADIRQMIENCFIYNGFDSFISKLAYKLEIILEQKLALLSR